jgi:hypothetical protein
MFHTIGIYLTNIPFSNTLINLALDGNMGLLSVPPVYLKYTDTPEFTSNLFWNRSDKLAGVPKPVYKMIPIGDEYLIE